jgi:hypothetical protein
MFVAVLLTGIVTCVPVLKCANTLNLYVAKEREC